MFVRLFRPCSELTTMLLQLALAVPAAAAALLFKLAFNLWRKRWVPWGAQAGVAGARKEDFGSGKVDVLSCQRKVKASTEL
jgi:hypothetical protein